MEAFVLLPAIPLLVLGLFGCAYLWRLINHGSTGGRVAGWLFFIPSVLLTLTTLFAIIAILTYEEKLELTAPPERPAVDSPLVSSAEASARAALFSARHHAPGGWPTKPSG